MSAGLPFVAGFGDTNGNSIDQFDGPEGLR